jgi:hypothetical protein
LGKALASESSDRSRCNLSPAESSV